MVAASFAHGGNAPRSNCARYHADRAEHIQSAALEVLAGYIFEGLPARPKIYAVPYLCIARDSADFRIDEMRHQARDGVIGDDRICIDTNEEFGILNMLDAIVKSFGLSGVRLGKD